MDMKGIFISQQGEASPALSSQQEVSTELLLLWKGLIQNLVLCRLVWGPLRACICAFNIISHTFLIPFLHTGWIMKVCSTAVVWPEWFLKA